MRGDITKAIGSIERKLSRLYSEVLDEPLPPSLQNLLTELEQANGRVGRARVELRRALSKQGRVSS